MTAEFAQFIALVVGSGGVAAILSALIGAVQNRKKPVVDESIAMKTLAESVAQIAKVQSEVISLKDGETLRLRERYTKLETQLQAEVSERYIEMARREQSEAYVRVLSEKAEQLGPTIRFQENQIAELKSDRDKFRDELDDCRSEYRALESDRDRLKAESEKLGAILAQEIQSGTSQHNNGTPKLDT